MKMLTHVKDNGNPATVYVDDPFESNPDMSGFLLARPDDAAVDEKPSPANEDKPGRESVAKKEVIAFFDAMEQAVNDGSADDDTAWNYAAIRRLLECLDDEKTLAVEYDNSVKALPMFDGKAFSSLSEDEKTAARAAVEREFFARSYGELSGQTMFSESSSASLMVVEQPDNPAEDAGEEREKPRSAWREALDYYDELHNAVQEGSGDEETERDYAAIRRWLSRFDHEVVLCNEYERSARYLPRFDGKSFSALSDSEKDDARTTVEREFFARTYGQFLEERRKSSGAEKGNQAAREKKPEKPTNGGWGIGNDLAKLFANCTKWIMSVIRGVLYAPLPKDVNRVFEKIGNREIAGMRDDDEASPSP